MDWLEGVVFFLLRHWQIELFIFALLFLVALTALCVVVCCERRVVIVVPSCPPAPATAPMTRPGASPLTQTRPNGGFWLETYRSRMFRGLFHNKPG